MTDTTKAERRARAVAVDMLFEFDADKLAALITDRDSLAAQVAQMQEALDNAAGNVAQFIGYVESALAAAGADSYITTRVERMADTLRIALAATAPQDPQARPGHEFAAAIRALKA